jgi:hypothetical protein
MVICYIFPVLVCLNQENSGNPDPQPRPSDKGFHIFAISWRKLGPERAQAQARRPDPEPAHQASKSPSPQCKAQARPEPTLNRPAPDLAKTNKTM